MDITSTQAGNWSAGSTWSGGVPPTAGDNAIVNHAVTVDVDTIVGTSPAGSDFTNHLAEVKAIIATEDITIAAGVRLTVRGNTTLSQCILTQEAGAIYEFDASQSVTPLGQKYWLLLSIDWAGLAWAQSNGTEEARCSFESNVAGGNGFINTYSDPVGTGATRGGSFRNSTYVDFTRIGDAVNPAIQMTPNNSNYEFSIRHSVWDTCGKLTAYSSLQPNTPFQFENVTFKNTLDNECVSLAFGTAPTALRSVQNCVFDKIVTFNTPVGATLNGNIFNEAYSGTTTAKSASFQGCLVRDTTQPSRVATGDMTGNYILKDGDLANPHFISAPSNFSCDFIGNIFDMVGTRSADFGDCILGTSFAGTFNVKENLFLRDDSATISLLGSSGQTWNYEKNTTKYQLNLNETSSGYAGMVDVCRSNLHFDTGTANHYLVNNVGGAMVDDVITPANLDYNAIFNVLAGSGGNGINIPMSTTHSANSIIADPEFVDSTRNIETWDASVGGNGTVGNAMTELMKLNTADHNPAYTVDAMMTWVKEGFAPTNPVYQYAAYDGGTIGAIEFSTGGSTSSKVGLLLNLYIGLT